MAAVIAYNPTATPLVILGGVLTVKTLGGSRQVPSASGALPTGPGSTGAVPAGGYVVLGPVSVAVHSAAAANSFQAVAQDTQGQQPAHLYAPGPQPQITVLVGATLYVSDGTTSEAATAPLLVDVAVAPPLGWQGGALELASANNLVTYLAGVL
jgi:hypothetical protein